MLYTQEISIETIPCFRLGHATNADARTGCTVVLCEEGAVASYDLRGSAPGTRDTELLRPGFLVNEVNAVLLTGGSAFGLDAAGGVQRFLEERKKGYDARGVIVPIVPSAVIFDLHVGSSTIRPDAEMAHQACENATEDTWTMGQIGVGTGATVGKILGMDYAMAGGIGYAAEALQSGLIVSAVAVVNALGDVIDPTSGQIVAGAKKPETDEFLDSCKYMKNMPVTPPLTTENTTLAVVMTNGSFTKVDMQKIAQMAQNGIGRCIRPAHSLYDGDLVFALSRGTVSADVNLAGEMAAECVAEAILQACRIANPPQQS